MFLSLWSLTTSSPDYEIICYYLFKLSVHFDDTSCFWFENRHNYLHKLCSDLHLLLMVSSTYLSQTPGASVRRPVWLIQSKCHHDHQHGITSGSKKELISVKTKRKWKRLIMWVTTSRNDMPVKHWLLLMVFWVIPYKRFESGLVSLGSELWQKL